MLPRRTRRSTSRTAKKPANSLVNPWVSRMNSSANQISPVSHRREVISRLDIFFLTGRFSQNTLENPVRAASCREYAVNGPVYARRKAGQAARQREAAWPLVELPEHRMGSVRRTFWTAEKFENHDPGGDQARPAAAGSARVPHFPPVDFRLEPDQQFAAEIEHGPLDHRGLRQHQGKRLTLVQAFLVTIRQFSKRGAGAIEQRLPAEFIGPALEFFLGNALGFVIVKPVSHAVAVEPGVGLLHGVAVLDAVDGDRQFRRPACKSVAALHVTPAVRIAPAPGLRRVRSDAPSFRAACPCRVRLPRG